jgi:hypothetical protein
MYFNYGVFGLVNLDDVDGVEFSTLVCCVEDRVPVEVDDDEVPLFVNLTAEICVSALKIAATSLTVAPCASNSHFDQ